MVESRVDGYEAMPAIPLGLALARLPAEAPDRDAWPMLARRLAARRRAPRWPLALAASVVLGLIALPAGLEPPRAASVAATASQAAAERTTQLAALMSESQRLERLLAAADARSSSATAAAMSLAYDDGLRAIDAALEANRDGARQLALWQQRVDLLREAAAVETSRRYLASQGRNFDVALVAAY
jgi:hypothetical protein